MVQTPRPSEKLFIELPDSLVLQVTQAQFELLATVNRDLRLERTAKGELIVNPPTGWKTGEQNWSISGELYLWWRNSAQPGKGFDSSTGFILPNGATRVGVFLGSALLDGPHSQKNPNTALFSSVPILWLSCALNQIVFLSYKPRCKNT